MNKTTKRILMSLLALSMLSTNCVGVFANSFPETVSEQNLEQQKIKEAKEKLDRVILDVKKKVEVSAYHNVFSSDVYLDNGMIYYSLKWSSSFSDKELSEKLNISLDEFKTIVSKCENGKLLMSHEQKIVEILNNEISRLNVIVDEEGTIISVNKNFNVMRSEDEIWGIKKIGNYSDDKLVDISYEFLNKVLEKDILEKFRKDKIEITNSYENNYVVKIPQYDRFQQIEIEDQYILLEIDQNGKVISYNLVYDKSIYFEEDFVDIYLSHDQIYNLFAENEGLTFKYKSFYNEETEESEFIPVYEIDHNVYINAMNGLLEEVSRGGYRTYSNKNESMTFDNAAGLEEEGFLTPEEIAEVTQYSNLISVNKVIEDLGKTGVFFNNFNYEVNNFYYESIKYEDQSDYVLYIDLNKIENGNKIGTMTINVNAVTGEINYINSYDYKDENEDKNKVAPYDSELVNSKIENFLKSYNDKFDNYKRHILTKEETTVTIKYTRFINDVICPEDYINIKFDFENNNIISYNKKYSDYKIIDVNDEFSNMKTILKKLDSDNLLELKYIVGTNLKVDRNKKSSFFVFKVADENEKYYVSAADGEYLNRNGNKFSKIVKKDFDVIYSNVDTNISKMLEKLYKLDIYINKENININDYITFGEFKDLLNKCYVYEQSNLKSEEDAKFVKRENMAELLVNKFTYYQNLLKLSGIFKTDYYDENDITVDKIGYVAIAAKLCFINDENGYFRPQDNLTYKEAFEIVYNLVK